MINKFGKVMVYVKDPRAVADFQTEKIGFTEVGQQEMNNQVLSIELAPNETSDCHLVLFNRAIVEEMSGDIPLGTPSILFGSYDIDHAEYPYSQRGNGQRNYGNGQPNL